MSETKLDKYMKTIDWNQDTDLSKLFALWKEEHKKEVEDIKEQIKNMKSENSQECDGEIFRKKIYNECTISSHFIQFFYREQCKNCAEIKEKTAWEYVLENAFNADGCVGNYDIAENGYKYIALLKEANDSDKCCVREDYQTEEDIPNRWLTDWRKDKNNRKYNMLVEYVSRNVEANYYVVSGVLKQIIARSKDSDKPMTSFQRLLRELEYMKYECMIAKEKKFSLAIT